MYPGRRGGCHLTRGSGAGRHLVREGRSRAWTCGQPHLGGIPGADVAPEGVPGPCRAGRASIGRYGRGDGDAVGRGAFWQLADPWQAQDTPDGPAITVGTSKPDFGWFGAPSLTVSVLLRLPSGVSLALNQETGALSLTDVRPPKAAVTLVAGSLTVSGAGGGLSAAVTSGPCRSPAGASPGSPSRWLTGRSQ